MPSLSNWPPPGQAAGHQPRQPTTPMIPVPHPVMQRLLIVVVTLMCATSSGAQTIVKRHGQLTVDGNRIKDECGRVAQVKGMSFFWSQWEGKEYYNADVVKWLRDDWKVEVVRAALAVRNGPDDYIGKPTENYNRVVAVLDGAVEHGVYGIADFHAHYANQHLSEAKTFFRQISQRYGDTPNIIYEIWNEPIGEYGDAGGRANWRDIKAYSREIISVIRDNDPDGLIVVGTPFYDQRPDIAAEDPLTVDSKNRPVGNVAYTIHAYAGAHRQEVRDWGQEALDAGLALFMTESGRTGTNYGPGNNIDAAEWDRWEAWMDGRGISYTKWSLSDKNEVSSSLQPNASTNGGWTTSQLRPEGQWNRNHFRTVNATQPPVCGGSGNADDIKSTSTPTSVRRGQTITVGIDYSVSANRDIQVVFQRDSDPFTTYASKKIDVSAGSGSRNVSLTIPNTVPVANGDYQIQVFVTTDGGDWDDRLDNLVKRDIDVTAAPATTNKNIYTDNFSSGWADWSWGGTATTRDSGVKYAGSYSYKYLFTGSGAVSFRHPDGVPSDDLVRLEFWARTWSGNTTYTVSGSYDDEYGNRSSGKNITVTPTWQKFTLTKAELGNFGWYRRFFLSNGSASGTIFLDNVRLVYNGQANASNAVAADERTGPGVGANDLLVYPNPSQGAFAIDLNLIEATPNLSIQVLDVTGRVVLQQTHDAAAGRQHIDLALDGQSSAGVYLLRVRDAAGTLQITRKIVVNK